VPFSEQILSNYLLVAGLLFVLFISLYSLIRGRWVLAFLKGSFATLGLFVSLFGLFLVWQSNDFQLVASETKVGDVYINKQGLQRFQVTLLRPETAEQSFVLYGDNWQLDARVMSWDGLPKWLTPSASYRLERLSGRYNSIIQERGLERSLYSVHSEKVGDQVWDWLSEFPLVPGLSLKYGSSIYVPMIDQGVYEVWISSTGLKVRPGSKITNSALEQWK